MIECVSCGASSLATYQFCPSCGEPFDSHAEPSTSDDAENLDLPAIARDAISRLTVSARRNASTDKYSEPTTSVVLIDSEAAEQLFLRRHALAGLKIPRRLMQRISETGH